ncbi:hypothetical protein EG68_03877 [Paragonimus skrjabini miyazakii]|uniref:Ig-like domain-containing protein n=1 Tax=Paragonimus skrjabini miyazakii TaxID=59628 RepID=A0A8S9Z0E3_9TREM|nr:hypothetical protein EG68_03877 [Paragonimus skrjabini miyazakii]
MFLINLPDTVHYVQAVQGCNIFFQENFKWKRAICDSESTGQIQIPLELPVNLVDLSVKLRLIPLLTNSGLLPLIHLEILQIESCGVVRVEANALQSLSNLRHLSLRNNSLHLGYNGLPKEVLNGLPNLRVLNLAENPIDLIPDSFFALTMGSQLHTLWLGSTKSSAMHIEPDAFSHMPRLRLLDLSFSRLTNLPSNMEQSLRNMMELSELYLGGNLWHCDCKLRWLRIWFRQHSSNRIEYIQKHFDLHSRKLLTEPTCFTPDIMRDRPIFGEQVTEEDFKCAPKMLTESRNVTVTVGKSVRLSCEFYADPITRVLWFRNNEMIRNTSQTSMIMHKTGETYLATLHVAFDEVADSERWSCLLEGHESGINTTFTVFVEPGGGLFLSGVSVVQQSWIYAGVGVGVLFILLTAIGIGIFYCCDPRSHSDQTLYRWVGKGQAGRLQSCYGCSKSISQIEKRKAKGNGNDHFYERRDPCGNAKDSPNSLSHLVSTHSHTVITSTSSTVTPLAQSEQSFTHLGGSLIHETASTGENRLLVSCDGPEPTVLLATRLAAQNGLESPASIYGLPGSVDLSFSPRLNPTSHVHSLEYVQNHSLQGQVIQTTVNPAHIYARVAPASCFLDVNRFANVPTSPQTRYNTPCPVHGSISFDHMKLTQLKNEGEQRNQIDDKVKQGFEQDELQPYDPLGNLVTTKKPNYHVTILDSLPKSCATESWCTPYINMTKCGNQKHTVTQSPIKSTQSSQFSDNPTHMNYSDDADDGSVSSDFDMNTRTKCVHQLSNSNFYEKKVEYQMDYTLRPESTASMYTRSNSHKLTYSSHPSPTSTCPVNTMPHRDSHFEKLSRQKFRGVMKHRGERKSDISKSPVIISVGNSKCSVFNPGLSLRPEEYSERDSPTDDMNGAHSDSSDRTSDSVHSDQTTESSSPQTLPNFYKINSTADKYLNSLEREQRLKRKESWCAVHYPSWRGYSSQVISPASDSVRSTTYRMTTLPSRFRKQQPIDPFRMVRSTGWDSRRSATRSRSQTLVRPGSKHKLDTDSGTDYNE